MYKAGAAAALRLAKRPNSLRCLLSFFHDNITIFPSSSSTFSTAQSPPHLSPPFFSPRLLASFSSSSPPQTPPTPPQPYDNDSDEMEDEECLVEWEEEEDDVEPVIGDGGDGGGVVLRDVGWGQRAHLVAREILSKHFDDDLVMYAFKVSPKGYIYVRLDKLTSKYGCPSIEEIKSFNSLYKQQLDDIVESGEIPIDLAVEVSSPGAERLLRVPDDLDRFKDMAMKVEYLEDLESKTHHKKDAVFMIDSVDIENSQCVWKLADVKENRAQAGKGRPLNRKQRDLRLQLPFEAIKKVTLHLN